MKKIAHLTLAAAAMAGMLAAVSITSSSSAEAQVRARGATQCVVANMGNRNATTSCLVKNQTGIVVREVTRPIRRIVKRIRF